MLNEKKFDLHSKMKFVLFFKKHSKLIFVFGTPDWWQLNSIMIMIIDQDINHLQLLVR